MDRDCLQPKAICRISRSVLQKIGERREQKVLKRASVFIAVLAIAVLTSMLVQAAVSAQGPTQPQRQGAPQPEQGVGQTVPVKVATRNYDKKLLLSAPSLSESALRGRALWLQRCAYCHDGVGTPTYKTMGPWMDSDTVKQFGEDTMKVILSAGTVRMPSFKYDLDSQQMDDVIAFIKTVSPDQKPTQSQLDGKVTTSDTSD